MPPSPELPRTLVEAKNTSGTNGPVPEEVLRMGYCWPAFVFPTFWQSAHGIPCPSQTFAVFNHSYVGTRFHLGDNGYRLAWQYRHFRDLQHFQETMKVWQAATKVIPLIGFLIVIAWQFGENFANRYYH